MIQLKRWLATFVLFGLLADGQQAQTPPKRAPITALAASRDGGTIWFGSQAGVFALDAGREPMPALTTELDFVHHLALSPDGSLIAVAGGTPGEFGAVE